MLLLKCLFSYFIFSLFMSLRASQVVVCVNISAWSAIWTTETKNCNVCVSVMCCGFRSQCTATKLFGYSINLSYDTAAACIITILFFVDIVIIFTCADGVAVALWCIGSICPHGDNHNEHFIFSPSFIFTYLHLWRPGNSTLLPHG